jgi:hypothetical protein
MCLSFILLNCFQFFFNPPLTEGTGVAKGRKRSGEPKGKQNMIFI